MRQSTVGVIGHVNHGKTSLVRALTGIDTDRLDEEKRRGMSIVLGFAHLQLAAGVVDFVDVPGHEQFVRTMVAGATGIAASLLVVHAREGIKPQTVEHVAIADLVGVRRGIVAITKADLVDAQERADVQRRVRAFLRGTHLEFAPVVFTSTVSGEGLDALRDAIAALLQAEGGRSTGHGRFWLPVDRVFTLAGHGTIVTGTLRGGPLRAGDAIASFPRGSAGSVRQLQVHGRGVEEAHPGQRVGVNLRHLDAEAVARGDVLAPPHSLQASSRVDVELRLQPGVAPDQVDGRRVRLLFGTTEVGALVRLLGAGGATTLLAQVRTMEPVVAVAGEAFVLRRESPPATLGGGRILDGAPSRHARGDAEAVRRLRVLAGGSSRQRLDERLRAAGHGGLALAGLATETGVPPADLARDLQGLAFVHGQRVWHPAVVEDLKQRVLDALQAYHAAYPLRPVAPLSQCRAALPQGTGEALRRRLLELLADEGRIVQRAGAVALAGHDPLQALDAADRTSLAELATAFRAGGMQPPDPPQTADARARSLLDLLVAQGEVLLLPGQPSTQRVAFHREALADARRRLAAAFPPPDAFTVSQARELLASTRKFTVPLLEHLHATGQTRRRGDLHAFVPDRSPGGE
jgi:selenocysteine-specific elongation factor